MWHPSARKAGFERQALLDQSDILLWQRDPLFGEGKAVDVAYLGSRKAFGTISHIILWEKLAARGLDSAVLNE